MTLKILVIDDSANIQKMVGLAFSDENAVVESVSDGDIALEIVRDFRPDVVLVDVLMPGCNGYEICSRIKEDPGLSDTAVVLLAGTFDPYDEVEAARARSNGFLTKPFDTSDLLQTVHALAEGKQRERRAENETGGVRMDARDTVTGDPESKCFRLHNLAGPVVRESFLGSDRILDLFDSDQLSAARASYAASVQKTELQAAHGAPAAESAPTVDVVFSENTLSRIVDTVVRRMSAEAIREVAWEVVPELSEGIIRRTIEEQNKA